MGVIPIVNENDTLAVAVRKKFQLHAFYETRADNIFRKSNSAIMIRYRPSLRPWFRQTTCSL